MVPLRHYRAAVVLPTVPQSYYWYKKTKEECEAAGPCAMGGYTRLLHRWAGGRLVADPGGLVIGLAGG